MDGRLTAAFTRRRRNSCGGVLSSDVGFEMAVDKVSVGVEHHRGGETYLGGYRGVLCSDMAPEGAADGFLQWRVGLWVRVRWGWRFCGWGHLPGGISSSDRVVERLWVDFQQVSCIMGAGKLTWGHIVQFRALMWHSKALWTGFTAVGGLWVCVRWARRRCGRGNTPAGVLSGDVALERATDWVCSGGGAVGTCLGCGGRGCEFAW